MTDPRFWTSGEIRTERRMPQPTITLPDQVRRLFSKIQVNTIAVFGIGTTVDDLPVDFQVGADRILTRTIQQ